MRLPPLQALVFDFDGTLAHLNIDFGEMRERVLRLLEEYGLDRGPFAGFFVLEMIAAGRDRLRERDAGAAETFFHRAHDGIRQIELDAAAEGALFPETRPLLAALLARGFRIAVVTRNCEGALALLFPDMADCCHAIVTRERTPRVKPDPEHLRQALARLGVAPSQAAMVGDHPMDIRLGQAVGAYTIGVLSGYATREELAATGADAIVPGIAALPGLLSPQPMEDPLPKQDDRLE